MKPSDYKPLLFLPVLSLLAACADNASTESVTAAASSLDRAWGTFARTTRSTDNDSWDMYDQIGITMCYHCPEVHRDAQRNDGIFYDAVTGAVPFNCCYFTATAGSSEFVYYGPQHRIWFPTDSTMVDFVSYYPYNEQLEVGSHLYPVDLRQQSTSGLPLSRYDLMWGLAKGLDKGNTMVEIPFHHQLTQVLCYIKPLGELPASALLDASVSISHQPQQAQMDVLTSRMQYADSRDDLQLSTSIVMIDGDSCLEARAIILPNDPLQNPVAYKPSTDRQESLELNRHILLSLPSLDGIVLSANLKDTDFRPGQKHVFRLEAQVSKLNMLSGEIVEWETVEHSDVTIVD